MGQLTRIATNRLIHFNWRILSVIGLLTLVALAFVPLTLTLLQSRDSDALLIDVAGRQRMLLERYMKEVLEASQGMPSEYLHTQLLINERWDALVRGGETIIDGQTISLPAAPTDAIKTKLLHQRDQLQSFTMKIEMLLHLPPGDLHASVREEVIKDSGSLLENAHQIVSLLDQYSDDRIRRLIWGESAAVLLIVIVASLGTWRFFRAEQELKQSHATAMEALREGDALKSALLSSVSHELRTPLTAIRSMLFGLRDELQINQYEGEFLAGIEEQLDYLNRLVGNLLDMSRLEAGALKPRRDWHMLEELMEEGIRRVDALLRGRCLEVELAADLPPVFVDGVQIQQVMVNLLENAAKFSPMDSRIRITAGVKNQELEVSVSNSGEAIPPHELQRIFERFYRLKSKGVSAAPGTGLGLAICKGIIESHGGKIKAESRPEGTTTLLFWLPLTYPNDHDQTFFPASQPAQRAS
jgi:two-component system sensor histidine kinase KdpD